MFPGALQDVLLTDDSALAVAIAKKLLTKAKKGDIKASELVAERVEAKPKRQIETTDIGDSLVELETITDQELKRRILELTEQLKVPI